VTIIKTWRAIGGAVAVAALYGASVLAGSAEAASGKETPRFGRGVLWRIEPVRGTPSYLLGTLHSDDPRVTDLPPAVRSAFKRAGSVTLETLLDSAALVTLAENMFYHDGRTLRGVLGDSLYAATRAALHAHGLPADSIDHYKPWAVFLALQAPRGTALDLVLQTEAVQAGKPVYGLETTKEQIDVFDQLPADDQITLLREQLRQQQTHRERLEELTRAYLARDLAAITGFIEKYRPTDARVHGILVDRLLHARNRRMAQRMQRRLQEGNAFIAIGAAHLAGSTGVLTLLEQQGYRVSPVY
jgi:uncharacterized protein